MLSEGTYIIVFQDANLLGIGLSPLFHRLVVNDLLAAHNAQHRARLNGYALLEPDAWHKYEALQIHGGLHVTLGTELPARDIYIFIIDGYKFVPALNTDNAVDMPGFYALQLRSIAEPPIPNLFDYHASVAQMFRTE